MGKNLITNPEIFWQLGGEAGIRQTVSRMVTITNRAMLHPAIRERAATITRHCRRNVTCEETSLLGWTNGAIQFIRDPYGVEALHDPVTFMEQRLRTQKKPYGDCDDMSMYLAALLKSIGHAPAFKIISRFKDGRLHHVFVFCHGKDLDPTLALGTIRGKPCRVELVGI